MSLTQLKELETKIVSKHTNLDEIIHIHDNLQNKRRRLKEKLSEAKREYDTLMNAATKKDKKEYESKSVLGKISHKFALRSDQAREQANKLYWEKPRKIIIEIHAIEKQIDAMGGKLSAEDSLRRIRWNIKRKTNRAAKEAIAAAHINKSRELAVSVKRELLEQKRVLPFCPYCVGALGPDPHCDHIRPVALGGLSTQDNMVYVCADCNRRKRDLTLTQFIKKHGLNRESIEKHLDDLGKIY